LKEISGLKVTLEMIVFVDQVDARIRKVWDEIREVYDRRADV